MKNRSFALMLFTMAAVITTYAASVKVVMNTVSTTMKLKSVADGSEIEVGTPVSRSYTFNVAPGDYTLVGYATNGTTVNGDIKITVADTDDQQTFEVMTCTAYATNKNWVENTDYTMEASVTARTGESIDITTGRSSSKGMTFLLLKGNSYKVDYIPAASREAEGYCRTFKSAPVTGNVTASATIPMGADYVVSVPENADFSLNIKFAHFTDFYPIVPTESKTEDGIRYMTYYLAQGQEYNYRTSIAGQLTLAGVFTLGAKEEERPALNFTMSDYEGNPKEIIHDYSHNSGYETGDIFVNINSEGHLRMNIGETYTAHAMRSWELTNSVVGNHFIEPDFHYTVLDLDGKPSQGIIEVVQTPGSAWSQIKAVGQGTALVLVTYDAIKVNAFNKATKNGFVGGEFWSAIWPENTAVYVVSVGQPEATVSINMYVNSDVNNGSKLSGMAVDAEHDVFYYLEDEEGAIYTFNPEGAESVTISYPISKDGSISYNGFSNDGVTVNDDGSYTLLLKKGRQIVCLTDVSGNHSFQVLTAKPCSYQATVVNANDPNGLFKPGDEVNIQFQGLAHPANKLAGIYNMTAKVDYRQVPTGVKVTTGKGSQYQFGSNAAAQSISVKIPETFDIDENPVLVIDGGSLAISGYGDPLGSHREIDNIGGRQPNFTAIAHNAKLGVLPRIELAMSPDISTGVDNLLEENLEVVKYYNLQGIPSETPYRGINIVKMSDGSVRKMFIK